MFLSLLRVIFKDVKKALFLIPKFLVLFLLFTVLAAFAYMFYCQCELMIIGNQIGIFSLKSFLAGIILTIPFTSIFSLFLLFVSCIRNHNYTAWSAGVIFFVALLIFSTIIPLAFNARLNVIDSAAAGQQKPALQLHSGYFKTTDFGDYYFLDVEGRAFASGVFVSGAKMQEENKLIETFRNESFEATPPGFAKDYQLATQSVRLPRSFGMILDALNAICDFAYAAYAKGWFTYFCCASIACALLSMWAVSFVSTWPLLCVLFILYDFAAAVALNFAIVATPFAAPAISFISEWISPALAQYVLLLAANLLYFLIFTIFGIGAHLKRRHQSLGA